MVSLRSASFFVDQLFDGQAKPVVTRLENLAQDFNHQKSIKAMVAATQQLAKPLNPHSQQKSPFQGAGTSQVPKNRKPTSKGAKSSKPAGRGPQTWQQLSTQPKQGTSVLAGNQSTKPPARETHSAQENLFKGGSRK